MAATGPAEHRVRVTEVELVHLVKATRGSGGVINCAWGAPYVYVRGVEALWIIRELQALRGQRGQASA